MRPLRRLLAPVAVASIAAALVLALVWAGPRTGDLPDTAGTAPDWFATDPVHALVTAVGLVAWAGVLWLCAGLVFAALAALPGGAGRVAAALARLMLPRAIRRLLEISLGLTLVAGTAAPALAATPAAAGHPVATVATATNGDRAGFAWPDSDRPSGLPVLGPLATAPAPRLAPPESAAVDVLPVDAQMAPQTPDTASPTTGAPWPDSDRPSPPPPPAPSPTTTPTPGAPWPDSDRPETAGGTPVPGPPTTAPELRAAPPEPGTPETLQAVPAGAEVAQPTPTATPTTRTPTAGTPTPGAPWPDSDRPETAEGDPLLGPAGMGDPAADAAAAAEVVVRRGDTLWSIVARHLGPSASPADIDTEWPRWWAANRDVIGPDPDVIFPGQRLLPPPGP